MGLRDTRVGRWVGRTVIRLIALVREIIRRYVDVGAIERGVAIGSQAFTALLPMLMLYTALVPTREGVSFTDALVSRFHLEGAEAAALRAAFHPAEGLGEARSSTSAIGVVLLIIAALSFTRTMQRLYERCYGLDRLGFKGTPYGLLWLVVLGIPAVVRGLVGNHLTGAWLLLALLTLNSISWFLTPVILSSRRLTCRRVAPTAIITGIAMTVLGVASAYWLPHSVAVSASEYGIIGVAFALISWLVGAGITVSVAAVVGSAISDEFDPPTPASLLEAEIDTVPLEANA